MSERSAIGSMGEECAVRYLQKERKGKILGRNVRLKTGEIDIVAKEGKTIVFVEVKAAKQDREGFRPEDHFDRRKARKLRTVCREYLLKENYPEDTDWRVDLASVILDYSSQAEQVRYYTNVVEE